MTGPSDQEVGANLAELYRKGSVTLPGVAAEIGAARSSLGGADTWGPFVRSTGGMYGDSPIVRFPPGFGGEANGPGDAFATAIGALGGHLYELHRVLADCGPNIVATAQDYARTDAEIRAAFIAEGGKL